MNGQIGIYGVAYLKRIPLPSVEIGRVVVMARAMVMEAGANREWAFR